MARTKNSPAKALKANEDLVDTEPSGEDSDVESMEPMRSGSDDKEVDDDSTAGDSNTNEGDESTTNGDDDGDTDALSVQSPKKKPSPRGIAKGAPSRTKPKAWQAKQARIAKVATAKAKAAKAKAAATRKKATEPPPEKRVVKGHWSGYNGRDEHQKLGRMIANALQLCCNTSNAATIKFLVEGLDNA